VGHVPRGRSRVIECYLDKDDQSALQLLTDKGYPPIALLDAPSPEWEVTHSLVDRRRSQRG
jgi:hypothetical protein